MTNPITILNKRFLFWKYKKVSYNRPPTLENSELQRCLRCQHKEIARRGGLLPDVFPTLELSQKRVKKEFAAMRSFVNTLKVSWHDKYFAEMYKDFKGPFKHFKEALDFAATKIF